MDNFDLGTENADYVFQSLAISLASRSLTLPKDKVKHAEPLNVGEVRIADDADGLSTISIGTILGTVVVREQIDPKAFYRYTATLDPRIEQMNLIPKEEYLSYESIKILLGTPIENPPGIVSHGNNIADRLAALW
jgi:hypothetical protein